MLGPGLSKLGHWGWAFICLVRFSVYLGILHVLQTIMAPGIRRKVQSCFWVVEPHKVLFIL